MEYNSIIFDKTPDLSAVPVAAIDSFHWEQPGYARPRSFAKLWAVKGEGIFARLWSFESNILCRYTERDDRIWCDSCLELFLAPVADDPRYINFEVNPNGAYLSQFGEKREGRTFVKALTTEAPVITPFTLDEADETAWGYQIFIPESLISALYTIPYTVTAGTVRGNFYKCADESVAPHYGAYFPVDSAALGFHNPACFGTILLNNK